MVVFSHEWALVDVETSGFRALQHRVLSIAVATVGKDGRPGEEFSTLLDPGCDPGPVHIHGLTADRLKGSPKFGDVAERVAEMLEGRVLVAHNAPFDYGFLAQEFTRAGKSLPVQARLCTLALNRRLAPATSDLKLATLAAHYGVRMGQAHDAREDVRALAGVLRGSLDEAARLGVRLPLVTCPPKQNAGQDRVYPPSAPKVRCAFTCPGRLEDGAPLVQGMKVAITGETDVPREELVARSVAAGLNVTSSVSRFTSVLVTNNGGSGTAKARKARENGVPVIGERTFLRLLDDVRPGIAHGEPRPAVERAPGSPQPEIVRPVKAAAPEKPLDGRRVLVLGGTHPRASSARSRVVELGGAAAINLSASVTDVVALDGGDRRMERVARLELPVHEEGWLEAPERGPVRAGPRVLPRGGAVDLPQGGRWTVEASWVRHLSCEVDVVAFALDEDGQVSGDEDFVFYNAAETPDGSVRLVADGPAEQQIVVDLAALPEAVRKVTVAAAIDGDATFGELGAVELVVGPDDAESAFVQATLDAGTSERTMLLAELYRRGGVWRLRVVGQGHEFGLAGLARGFGVDIEE
ncbi:TerD family protein [Actinomadura montaniterrae]|uniref:DNA polymerase III n=1 Tax=Actinomadura montaniterrae TaxID=1803903 RepID=A0A6L3W350_9ACTN|nr:TerD family protein [Actinomadura montaniterrae]KAB2382783.1 DNA polymerase III [Actinomadura montaniterrae]